MKPAPTAPDKYSAWPTSGHGTRLWLSFDRDDRQVDIRGLAVPVEHGLHGRHDFGVRGERPARSTTPSRVVMGTSRSMRMDEAILMPPH